MSEILLVRHRITVDGNVIYEGDEDGEYGHDVYRIVRDAIVHSSLEARGITAPTPTQYREVVQACRKLSYWQRYGDRSVHWIQTGR